MGTCLKVSLIVICVILAIFFLTTGVMGAIASDSSTPGAVKAAIAAYFLMVAVFVLGIIAAAVNNRCLLITFIVVASIGAAFFLVAASLTVAAGLSKETAKDVIKQSDDETLGRAIKALFPNEECCACQYNPNSKTTPQCKAGELPRPDCCLELEKALKKNYLVGGGVTFALFVVQIATIVIAGMMCKETGEETGEHVMLAPLGPPMPGMPPPPGMPPLPVMPPPQGMPAQYGMPPSSGMPPSPGPQPGGPSPIGPDRSGSGRESGSGSGSGRMHLPK